MSSLSCSDGQPLVETLTGLPPFLMHPLPPAGVEMTSNLGGEGDLLMKLVDNMVLHIWPYLCLTNVLLDYVPPTRHAPHPQYDGLAVHLDQAVHRANVSFTNAATEGVIVLQHLWTCTEDYIHQHCMGRHNSMQNMTITLHGNVLASKANLH